jgi:hypothetical protein
MNAGKTIFTQLMDFLPWSTFDRIVARYDGNRAVRTLSCAAQYQVMAFAQLTYRESLRDIEACLSAQSTKLYHMGFREPIRRSTLADANETRDWRIYAEFAQRLIVQAKRLYAGDSLDVDLTNTVYALDSTTIDLCLSVFPWAHFRSTKAAVKMHTLLDLRGNIPSFIHISDGKLHDVHALDMLLPEPGAIYVMDRAYVDFTRLHVLHQAGAFFVTRAKSNLDAHRVYSAPTDKSVGVICDHTFALDGYLTRQHYPAHLRRIRFKDPDTGKTLVFLTNQMTLPALTICALYKSRWQVEILPSWRVSRLTEGLRDGCTMPALAQQAEFGFVYANKPQIVGKHRNLASGHGTTLDPAIDSTVRDTDPHNKFVDSQLSWLALFKPGYPGSTWCGRYAGTMQEVTHHPGRKSGTAFGWRPAFRIQGIRDRRRLATVGMQVADTLQQGWMVAHLRQACHRSPQVVLRLHAAGPIAFHENRLALALHRDDNAIQHQACDGLSIRGRGIRGRPDRGDV